MRIQPISTNNNSNNTNFKKLKIYKPQEWDVDVLDTVINNQSVKDFTKYLAEKGQDLIVSAPMKPFPMLMMWFNEKWQGVAKSVYNNKQEFLYECAKFDYKDIIKKETTEEMLQNKRKELLAKVDEFNKQL